MSDNPSNPFGPYANEVNALQRAVSYLQQRDSKTQSNQSTDNLTGITPQAPQLNEFQVQSIAWAVHDAIVKLEEIYGPSPNLATSGRKRTEMINGRINLNRHKRLCAICRHPDREAIEQAFIQWGRVGNILTEFDLPNRRCIYRHARAFGLFEQRAQNLRAALEYIIEEAEEVKPSADSIIRAIKAYSCLDEQGRWTELPQRIVVSRVDQAAAANSLFGASLPPTDAIPVAGRELESPPTPELPPAKT